MKILSNKKYHELLLKSCKGMFGAVTDDMLLRNNAFLAKEKEQLQQELQRKDNEIKQLREDIVNHIKIASEYKEQMIIKDNNWNKLKKWCNECLEYHRIAREEGQTTISDAFFEVVLDKINELEKGR